MAKAMKAMGAMKAAAPAKAMKVMKKAAMKRRAMKAAAPAKAMKAMKKAAMKRRAMKAAAPKAMKAMKAMKKKVISARLARRHAFVGKIDKTKTGLKKGDLVKNKGGRIVSKRASIRAKTNPWIAAVKKARAELKVKGFCAIKKDTPL